MDSNNDWATTYRAACQPTRVKEGVTMTREEENDEYDEDMSLLHPGVPPKIKIDGEWRFVEWNYIGGSS